MFISKNIRLKVENTVLLWVYILWVLRIVQLNYWSLFISHLMLKLDLYSYFYVFLNFPMLSCMDHIKACTKLCKWFYVTRPKRQNQA